MSDFIEFLLTSSGFRVTDQTPWRCRNKGIFKIIAKVYHNIKSEIKGRHIVRIYTADSPTEFEPERGVVELQTVSKSLDDPDVFPDFAFGNWEDMGLSDYDKFVLNVASFSDRDKIKDFKVFWKGNYQGVRQRARFMNFSKNRPDIFLSEFMRWTKNGPSSFTHIRDHSVHAFLIDLTGIGFSARLKFLPFCCRPLFIAKRPYWCWADSVIIQQGLHIEVMEDLSDLTDKYDWAVRNYDEAFLKAEKLMRFCKERLMFNNACDRATRLIRKRICKTRLL